MTQPTNTFDSYDAKGNREDLINKIFDISPTDTPFLNMAAQEVATGRTHEWQTDALAASADNAKVEGDEFAGEARVATARLQNYTQISSKTIVVSGTQESVSKAGRTSEMAYQVAKAVKEMKRDMETTLTGNYAAVLGDATTAPHLRSLEAWYSTNVSRGTNGASGSTTAAATDATTAGLRAFTEDLLSTVLQSVWTNGGKPDTIMLGAYNKQQLSGFTGRATRTIEAQSQKLVASVSVYTSDFGEDIKVVTNRFSRGRTVHILQSDMAAVAFMPKRKMKMVDLAVTGDNIKKGIVSEYTLQMRNEKAHGVIADLTVS